MFKAIANKQTIARETTWNILILTAEIVVSLIMLSVGLGAFYGHESYARTLADAMVGGVFGTGLYLAVISEIRASRTGQACPATDSH